MSESAAPHRHLKPEMTLKQRAEAVMELHWYEGGGLTRPLTEEDHVVTCPACVVKELLDALWKIEETPTDAATITGQVLDLA